EYLRAPAPLGADRAVPGTAPGDDGRDAGERLHVVDQCWPPPQPRRGGVGRPGSRRTAPPFDRRDERGLLPADEGAGSDANLDVEVEAGVGDAGAEQAGSLGLMNGSGEPPDRQRVLGAHVGVAARGADGVAGDRHAFEYLLGTALQDAAVHEGTRVTLIGV